MKFTLGATVPVMSYGNIQPLIEVEAETYEAAMAIAEKYIKDIWNRYGEKPLPESGNLVRLTDIFGNEIDYDADKHEYWREGVRYISGSEYAKQFEEPFDRVGISDRMAKGDSQKQQSLLEQWELNAEVSRGFGTALHGALELYGKYGKVHAHPILEKAVKEFYAGRDKEKAHYEALVVDHKNKRAGRIDRLTEYVEDFKSNGNITKSLPVYWEQLGFYRDICEANGMKIKGLKIHHWSGSWKTYDHQ